MSFKVDFFSECLFDTLQNDDSTVS